MAIVKQYVHTCDSCLRQTTTHKEYLEGWGYVPREWSAGPPEYHCKTCIEYRKEVNARKQAQEYYERCLTNQY